MRWEKAGATDGRARLRLVGKSERAGTSTCSMATGKGMRAGNA